MVSSRNGKGKRLRGLSLRRVAIVSLMLLIFPFLTGFGDTPGARNRRGNAHYRASEFNEALAEYRSGQVMAPELEELAFNSGNALFRMEEFDSALREYLNAAASFDDELSAVSYYNAGNAQLSAGDPEAAMESFKQSLRTNPGDLDAKYNLEVARALLDEREKQQQSDQKQGDDQGEERNDEQEEEQGEEKSDEQQDDQQGEHDDQGEEKSDGRQDDQQGENQEEQDRDDQPGEEEQEQSSDPSQGDGEQDEMSMSREDAERLLDAIDRGERELLAELRAARARKREKVDKDW